MNAYMRGHAYALGMAQIFLVGSICNFAVVYTNGMKMPVFSDDPKHVAAAQASKLHMVGSDSTRLPYLADRFPTLGGGAVFSVGDVFIYVGTIANLAYLRIYPPSFLW